MDKQKPDGSLTSCESGNLTERTLHNFINASGTGALVVDNRGLIVFANTSALQLLGWQEQQLVGRAIDVIIPERLRGSHSKGFLRVASGGDTRLIGRTIEVPALRHDGSEVPIDLTLSLWNENNSTYLGATLRDVSVRQARNARLMRQAETDVLTGLPNRRRFEADLTAAIESKTKILVAALDIAGFREINDQLGHSVGDSLLQAVAIRLPSAVPEGTVICRLGSDEFALFVQPPHSIDAAQLADTILDAFSEPVEIGGNVFVLSLTIGTAVYPDDATDCEELIAAAYEGIRWARKEDGPSWRAFAPAMRTETSDRHARTDEILKGFQKSEFHMYYQPQVSLSDGRLIGVEALLRWEHPNKGVLLPGAFLPFLQGTVMELPFGWWTLDEACRQLSVWQKTGLSGVRVGVNLFPAQFLSGLLVPRVEQAIRAHNVDPNLLELEVTEVISLRDDSSSLRQISHLREMGVRIALDDFGVGYASLSSIGKFPLDTIKIDRSFVQDLPVGRRSHSICRLMLAMAEEIGLDTVAEGIENDEQQTCLQDMGCVVGQGFLYGRAEPASRIEAVFQA